MEWRSTLIRDAMQNLTQRAQIEHSRRVTCRGREKLESKVVVSLICIPGFASKRSFAAGSKGSYVESCPVLGKRELYNEVSQC